MKSIASKEIWRGFAKTLAIGAVATQLMLPVQAALFNDIMGHWAQQDIQKLSDQSILGGYPDGTFRPEGNINRAEFATTLVKALGINTAAVMSAPSFRDVAPGNWAYGNVEAVRAAGLVNGYPGGLFLPTQNISRTEAMTILVKASGRPLPDAVTTEQILSRYPDAAQVPAWARPSVAAAIQAGIFVNYPNPNVIDPLKPATRAEVAVMTDNLRDVRLAGQPTTVLQGRVSTIPAQTTFTGTLNTVVNSELNKVGDAVSLTVDQPLVGSTGEVVIPAGSQILGRVALVEPAGRTGKNARMNISFTEIALQSGRRIPIEASVATENGVLEGGTTKGRILRAVGSTAIGAGLGAALGTAMGPLSGGKVGKGAIYGTAIGSGLGAVAAAAQKGKPVTVSAGDQLQIKLNQAITLEAAQ